MARIVPTLAVASILFGVLTVTPIYAHNEPIVYVKEVIQPVYIEKYVNNDQLREFAGVYSLQVWLRRWEYGEPYAPETNDCDDFAIAMIKDMVRDGYYAGIVVNTKHMKVTTFIDNVIYFIEPQTKELGKRLNGYYMLVDKGR